MTKCVDCGKDHKGFCEDIGKLEFTNTPSHEVKIDYPADPTQLANIMDWLWNGDFASLNMQNDMIERGRKRGIDITIVEKKD